MANEQQAPNGWKRRMPHPSQNVNVEKPSMGDDAPNLSNTQQLPPQSAQPPTAPPQTQPVQGTPTPPQAAPQQQVQYVKPQDMPTTFGQSQTTAPQPRTPSPLEQEMVQLRRQNDELIAALESRNQQYADMQQQYEQIRGYQDDADFSTLLDTVDFSDTGMDKESARKLLAPVVKGLRGKAAADVAALQQQNKAMQQQFDQRLAQFEQREYNRQRDAMYRKILTAHPDLQQLQNTDAYRAVMLSPVAGNAGITVGQVVAAEYNNGNADYIIDVLNQVRSRTQQPIDGMLGVAPSGVPTAPTEPSDGNEVLTPEQLADLRYQFTTRAISREEYKARLAKHRQAAQAAS